MESEHGAGVELSMYALPDASRPGASSCDRLIAFGNLMNRVHSCCTGERDSALTEVGVGLLVMDDRFHYLPCQCALFLLVA